MRTHSARALVLISGLLEIMQANHVDYTNFFRGLGELTAASDGRKSFLRDLFLDRAAFDDWEGRYRQRLRSEGSKEAERSVSMNRANPRFVLRNYLAQTAITLATEKRDFSEIERLLALLRHPYDEHPGMERYTGAPPDWSKHLVVSCSS